jgi:hypothetical protein
LLVVGASIGVIVGWMLPALASGKQRANRAGRRDWTLQPLPERVVWPKIASDDE